MNSVETYNALDGRRVERSFLERLLRIADDEKQNHVSEKIQKLLADFPDYNEFGIKILVPVVWVEPIILPGLNAPKNKCKKTKEKTKKKVSQVNTNLCSDAKKAIDNLKNKFGFVPASQSTHEPKDVFVLPGQIGKFLQKQQPHKALILIKGPKHTSKSQLAMQIADAFGQSGRPVAYIDYEQGGVESKDTVNSINRNTTPKGRELIAIKGYLDHPLSELKEFCKYCSCIIADSVTDLRITADQLNDLRNQFPKVIWIFISQVKENGEMYGGGKMAHNPTTIIECHPSENPALRYATLEKNRSNDINLMYSIYHKKIINTIPVEKPKKVKDNEPAN